MNPFLDELKRRKVVRVAVVYAATAFVLLQAADLLVAGLRLPEWVFPTITALLVLGFPVAVVLGWVLELTPHGVQVTTSSPTGPGEPPLSLLGRRTVVVTAFLVTLGLGLGAGLFLAPDAPPSEAGAATTPADARSLAVLAFMDLSETGDQKWFAEGLAEEILTSLARLPELRVIGRSSSFLFEAGRLDDRVVADTLGVAHLVKGSVRRVGDQLRVNAQLVRAADGQQLWSAVYDRSAADLLDVQRDVAEKVATALDVMLDDERRQLMFASGTRSVEAFEAYMRGLDLFQAAHAGQATLEAANVWLARALELDPRFARAAMLYADRYAHIVIFGTGNNAGSDDGLDAAEAMKRLRTALELAVRHAPDEYDRAMAAINREFFSPTWHRMPSLMDQVREHWHLAQPSAEDNWAPFVMLVTGSLDLARAHVELSVRMSPLEPVSWIHQARVELAQGNVERATAVLEEGRRTAGDHPFSRQTEHVIAVLSGDRDHFLRAGRIPVAMAAALRGDTAEALAMIRAQVKSGERTDPRWLWVLHEIGDRRTSRDLVRRIDAMPAGPAILLTQVYVWGRHTTFDVADAPNFSARLREAGVDPAALPMLPRVSAPEQGR
jgi:TolB-like protein